MRRILVFSVFITITPVIQGAGFNCAKAASAVEKLICADSDLSQLDSEMSKLYTGIKRTKGDRHIQALWLKERNECDSSQCLKSSYINRIIELRGTIEAGAIYDLVLDNGDKKTLVLPYTTTEGRSDKGSFHTIEGYVKKFSENRFLVAGSDSTEHEIKLVEGELSSDRVTGTGVWTSDGKSYHNFVMTRKMTYIESAARCVRDYETSSYFILGNQDFKKRVNEKAAFCNDGVDLSDNTDDPEYTEGSEDTTIVYLTENFLSLKGSGSTYEQGMAHPNHGSRFENYIYHDNQYTQVNLDHFLLDTPECKQKLTAALAAKLAECNLEPEPAYVSDENFSPTSKGLIIHYNPHEVGYAAGEPEIYLSSASVAGCLKNLPEESIYDEPEHGWMFCSGDD